MVEVAENTTLIHQLAERGVRHLRPVMVQELAGSLTTLALIRHLAAHPQPRFREALMLLFLRHPEYAPLVPEMVNSLDESAAMVLRHMYTTAVYLQRFWQGTLSLYLGEFPLLPDYFGQSKFHLSSPEQAFGEAGLRQLAALFKEKTGDDWWSSYQSAIGLFLDQLRLDYNVTYG